MGADKVISIGELKHASPPLPINNDLREELKDQAVKYLGKSLRPDEIKFVEFLPKTRSAKIVRGAIKKIYLGD